MHINMFPSKNTPFDYEADQRFWPKLEGSVDAMQFQQSPLRPTPLHRLSSSTDSTSPESYDNSCVSSEYSFRMYEPRRMSISSCEYNPILDMTEPKSIYDTPYTIRQRPILGRKILPERQCNSSEDQLWQIPEPSRNYELFPVEKMFDLTPPRNPTPLSSMLNTPPPQTIRNAPKASPIMNPINFDRPASSIGLGETKICSFCKKNGERPKVYMTHWVKEKVGNKFIVTCPVLRSHVCSQCGESGDKAHTITYCPVLRTTNNGKPLQSTTITLKNTRVLSNGRKRY
ncbi:uncharacterized protein LOC119836048 isoform X2 [Zerene cesonia]|uniref:uncharacterized protein LOC119836048 isoform X2 n=1 Tax=Zerene cesonia TaxID=33412 RepID=UPI0018E54C6E|nr:uncharacterized protein LOC119836048 isoform X2 [Zerene cesonia]